MTAYTMKRTVRLEDPAELREWWLATVNGDPDAYDGDAALELLLNDEYLNALELSATGLVSFGEVSVEREEEG